MNQYRTNLFLQIFMDTCLFTEEFVVFILDPSWPLRPFCDREKICGIVVFLPCHPPLLSERRWRKGGALACCPFCWKGKLCTQAGQQASADPDTNWCQQSSCHAGRGGTKHTSCHHSLFSGRSLKPHSSPP